MSLGRSPAGCRLAAAQASAHYAERSGWRFDNFPDATLPWDIYRESFIGIPPTRDPASSAFDVLFYDQVYKSETVEGGQLLRDVALEPDDPEAGRSLRLLPADRAIFG